MTSRFSKNDRLAQAEHWYERSLTARPKANKLFALRCMWLRLMEAENDL